LVSCIDVLDKGPLGTIGADVVWEDENLIESYFVNIYKNTEIIPNIAGNSNCYYDVYAPLTLSDEGRIRGNGFVYNEVAGRWSGTNTGSSLGYWKFGNLRAINTAIEQLNAATSLNDSYKEQKLGEAYMLRAILYFNMVIRYGGMPIIDHVQDVNLPVEELKIPRSTEKETYDFVLADIDKAIDYFEGKDFDKTHLNIWVAYALRSRAALYAASIAKNQSSLPLKDVNMLVGINEAEANKYYQISKEASEKLLPAPLGTGTQFSLQEGLTTENYRKIWNNPEGCSEVMFIQQFSGEGGLASHMDTWMLPRTTPEHVNWGAWAITYWDTFKWFEYKDGTSGTLTPDGGTNLDDITGIDKYYKLDSLFGNKDIRCFASIGMPGLKVNGVSSYFHTSVLSNEEADAKNVPRQAQNQNKINSAICAYKLGNNVKAVVPIGTGTNSQAIFRLSEIYLNYAEACFQLGETGNALDAVNKIRTRVGLTPQPSVDMDKIEYERKVELIFESHRYWDLKRWRKAKDPLNKEYKGVFWKYDVKNERFSMDVRGGDNKDRVFKDAYYYMPIPLGQIENNDALLQNPGYEIE
jgi:hypothetical protein